MNDTDKLRDQAQRCFRLAQSIDNCDVIAELGREPEAMVLQREQSRSDEPSRESRTDGAC